MSIQISLMQQSGEGFAFANNKRNIEGEYLSEQCIKKIGIFYEAHEILNIKNKNAVQCLETINELLKNGLEHCGNSRLFHDSLLSDSNVLHSRIKDSIATCESYVKKIFETAGSIGEWERNARRNRAEAVSRRDAARHQYEVHWQSIKYHQMQLETLYLKLSELQSQLSSCRNKDEVSQIKEQIANIELQINAIKQTIRSEEVLMRHEFNKMRHYEKEAQRLDEECNLAGEAMKINEKANEECASAKKYLDSAEHILMDCKNYLKEMDVKIDEVSESLKILIKEMENQQTFLNESKERIVLILRTIEEIDGISNKIREINDNIEETLTEFQNRMANLYDILGQIKCFHLNISIPRV